MHPVRRRRLGVREPPHSAVGRSTRLPLRWRRTLTPPGKQCLNLATQVVSRAKRRCLDSTPMQFRLIVQGRGIRGGFHERIQYADVEAKKAANRNDEAESAQTEIHRSVANEGAEPTGPRPCRFSAVAVCYVRPAVAGCASTTSPLLSPMLRKRRASVAQGAERFS
jgi:hypothetical protein